MPTLTVKLSDAEMERLERAAETRAQTKSELVRALLREVELEPLEVHPDSFFAQNRDLIGVIDDPSLPPDLSTNKKYFDSFGREKRSRHY